MKGAMPVMLLDFVDHGIKRINDSYYKKDVPVLLNIPLLSAKYRCALNIFSFYKTFTATYAFNKDDIPNYSKHVFDNAYNDFTNILVQIQEAKTNEELKHICDMFYENNIVRYMGQCSLHNFTYFAFPDTVDVRCIEDISVEDISKNLKDIFNFNRQDIHTLVLNMLKYEASLSQKVMIQNNMIVALQNLYPDAKFKFYGTMDSVEARFSHQEQAIQSMKQICAKCYSVDSTDMRIATDYDMAIQYTRLTDQFNNSFYLHLSHLKSGAPFFMIFPLASLTQRNLEAICNYLDNIIVKTIEINNYIVLQVYGTKIGKYEPDLNRYLDVIYQIISRQSADKVINVHGINRIEAPLFKNMNISEDDIIEALTNKQEDVHKIYNSIMENLILPEENAAHPLIPFSPGQLGLVLVSGYVDGIVDEGDGNYHVIKGFCYKDPVDNDTVDEDGTTIRNLTYFNRTAVRAFLGDGTFVSLS